MYNNNFLIIRMGIRLILVIFLIKSTVYGLPPKDYLSRFCFIVLGKRLLEIKVKNKKQTNHNRGFIRTYFLYTWRCHPFVTVHCLYSWPKRESYWRIISFRRSTSLVLYIKKEKTTHGFRIIFFSRAVFLRTSFTR